METMKVKDYARGCGIPVSLFTEVLSERLDERVTPARQVDVAALDDVRDLIVGTALDELADAREALVLAREDAAAMVKDAERELRRTVREALKEGMPATRVAQVLGVSRARVYQIRDGKR